MHVVRTVDLCWRTTKGPEKSPHVLWEFLFSIYSSIIDIHYTSRDRSDGHGEEEEKGRKAAGRGGGGIV